MSQVIPNHVLRVGQTVCMASKEDGGVFRQAGHPRGISITNTCSYVGGQLPSKLNGHILSHPVVYSAEKKLPSNSIQRIVGNVDYNQQNIHQAIPGGLNPSIKPQTNGPDVCKGGETLSPTLDISIDHLNQLILQLDPTFQPLPIRNGSAHDTFSCTTESTNTPNTPEIKCVVVNSNGAVCKENIQQTPSPAPKYEGLLISRGTDCNSHIPNGNLVFGEKSANFNWPQRHQSAGCCQQTQAIPIAYQRSNQNDPFQTSSLESETVQRSWPHFRNSEASIMSNSPGSDTSYLLGSTQSLPQDEIDGQSLHSNTAESPFGSLGFCSSLMSPGIMSPTTPAHYFDHSTEMFNSSLHKSTNQTKSLPAKGNANSCPPSVNNSSMDIPILLVNGCLESDGSFNKFPRRLQRRSSSTCNRSDKVGSERSGSTFSDNSIKDNQPGMKFVMHTSKQWFKPNMARDEAIEFLKDKEPGTFLIRDSTSFRGSFGLAMKVPGIPAKAGEETNALVRHFLIESSVKGVHLKGASEEPYFGSLSALVHQHTITPLSLPCKLVIPDKGQSDGESSPDSSPELSLSELKTTAACNVLYLNSVSTETLTGSSAIQKAVSTTFEMSSLLTPTIVHFKASEQGVTLTDVQRKVFFRRHYPISTVTFCSVDPELRKWQKHCRSSRIFGFVSKNPSDGSDNVCHIFAEYDAIQPASPLIGFLTNLIQQQRKAF